LSVTEKKKKKGKKNFIAVHYARNPSFGEGNQSSAKSTRENWPGYPQPSGTEVEHPRSRGGKPSHFEEGGKGGTSLYADFDGKRRKEKKRKKRRQCP